MADSHIRSVDSDDNSMKVEGYAIVFNEPSRQITENSETFYEFIIPDAISDIDWSQVMLLFNHDYNNLLARVDNDTLTITVDDKGVFFSAILPDTTLGRDTYEQVKNGNYKGCSFQFDYYPKDCQRITGQHGELFHKITKVSTISELSIVVVPAYDETTVAVARSLNQVVKQNKKESEEDIKLDKEEILKQLKALMEVVTGKDETDETEKPAKDEDKPEQVEDKSDDKPVDSEDKPAPDEPEVPEKEDKDKKPETRDDEDEEIKEDEDRDAVDDKKKDEESKPESDTEDDKGEDEESEDTPKDKDKKKDKGDKEMEIEVDTKKKDEATRSFEQFMKTKGATRDGLKTVDGQAVIPEQILSAYTVPNDPNNLAQYINKVTVSAPAGRLPILSHDTDPLVDVDELAANPEMSKPGIGQVDYKLVTKAGVLPVSFEMVQDAVVNIPQLVSEHAQYKNGRTEQVLIGKVLQGATASTVTGADGLKDAFNHDLANYQKTIVMTESAYAEVDKIKDANGRYLFQESLTAPSGKQLFGAPVVVVGDEILGKKGDVKLFIGDLKAFVLEATKADGVTIKWDDNDIRGSKALIYSRLDVVKADDKAGKFITFKPEAAQAPAAVK